RIAKHFAREDEGRRPLQRLVKIRPGPAPAPPPAVAAVAPFVAPAPAFPCERTAIEVPAVVATREPRITRECRMIGVARTPGMGSIASPAGGGSTGIPRPAGGGSAGIPGRARGGASSITRPPRRRPRAPPPG